MPKMAKKWVVLGLSLAGIVAVQQGIQKLERYIRRTAAREMYSLWQEYLTLRGG
jgi:hypothetical protein